MVSVLERLVKSDFVQHQPSELDHRKKKTFLVSVAGFTIASVLCGLSGTLSEIVAARRPQGVFDLSTGPGMAALTGEIKRQASMIAYLDDFWMMMWLTILVLPLLLIKPPKKNAHVVVDHAAME